MVEIIRRGHDDFVARIENRERDIEKRLIAAGRHHEAGAMRSADAHVVFFRKFGCDALQQLRRAGGALVFVIGRRGEEPLYFRYCALRRSIIHDTLAERYGAGMRAHQFGDHGNDRGLNGLQSAGFRHGRLESESCGP